ncbi:MAG: VWA domain-containing protein [Acidobacteriota bacterium]|nr:VWA domain-containing protein [Acidobacteriota bacterium]
MKPFACAALLSLAALAPAAAAQQQPAPTFRSAAAAIEVDVIVRDGDGRFVAGLTADDFELFEDGKAQPIQQFYLVSSAPDVDVSEVGGDPSARGADRRSNRMFIFLFDEDHLGTDAVARLKRSTEAFINDQMRGKDVAGIVAGGRMIGGRLTSSKPDLLAALRTVMPSPDTRAARMRTLREFPRLDSEFEASRIEAGDGRVLREAAERVCNDSQQLCQQEGGTAPVMERIEVKARQYINEARGSTGKIVRTLSMVASGLARMPGRKTLVLLSEGFFVEESRPVLQQIAAQAARSGVTIYGLDGRGLAGSGTREMADASTAGRGMTTTFDTAGDGPEILAGDTGGMVLRNASSFATALTRIAEDTSTYYVIGYAPGDPSLDGRFRKIEVKAKTRGLQVRSRKGYLATPLPAQATQRGGS